MRDKVYSILAWVILIPVMPYYIIKGMVLGIVGTIKGKSKQELIDEIENQFQS